jgi:transcription-repair coupling factor (superfamily II helicase)
MDALGFDLYTQMLERTVAELRGEQVEDETSVTLNLGVDVAIPEDYISIWGNVYGLTSASHLRGMMPP